MDSDVTTKLTWIAWSYYDNIMCGVESFELFVNQYVACESHYQGHCARPGAQSFSFDRTPPWLHLGGNLAPLLEGRKFYVFFYSTRTENGRTYMILTWMPNGTAFRYSSWANAYSFFLYFLLDRTVAIECSYSAIDFFNIKGGRQVCYSLVTTSVSPFSSFLWIAQLQLAMTCSIIDGDGS